MEAINEWIDAFLYSNVNKTRYPFQEGYDLKLEFECLSYEQVENISIILKELAINDSLCDKIINK
jgi:hypothetical protein